MEIKRIDQQASGSEGYELLDSGDGEKLERYGAYVVARPDPQALWEKSDANAWLHADGMFIRSGASGKWTFKVGTPYSWNVSLGGATFAVKPSSFKHTGIFPEQQGNWKCISESLAKRQDASMLNLFGYTGGATLAALGAGANCCHVDASKPSVEAASANAALSGFEKRPARWIVDDASRFVRRELKRGRTYDAIVMDPPSFGRGARGEVWKIEKDLMPLIKDIFGLLSKSPAFVLLNGYAAGYSAVAYANALDSALTAARAEGFRAKGTIEYGDLGIVQKTGRILPAGIYARLVFS